MNIFNKKVFLSLMFLILNQLLPANSFADTPSDDEFLELEKQIEQQEVEQEQAKQRAAEDARRSAEAQKLKEERARLEEERRKLEEQKQAELKRRQEEEEKTNRQKVQQQRIEAEAEKRKQFEQFMANAVTAMNNHDYKSALQAYSQALEKNPNDATALEGQTKAKEYQEICTALIGKWNWFLSKLIVHEDGTMQAIALIPNQGKWECSNPLKREFTLRWEVGGWIDTVTLSPDGNKTDAINNIGMRFKGSRIDSDADLSSPKEVDL